MSGLDSQLTAQLTRAVSLRLVTRLSPEVPRRLNPTINLPITLELESQTAAVLTVEFGHQVTAELSPKVAFVVAS